MRIVPKGFEWRGAHVPCHFDIDIHTGVLEAVWKAFPDRREAMAAAAASCGTVRTYLARSPQSLFPELPLHKAQRYSRRLVDDWYVDTNLNTERISRILPEVTRAAGLVWGKDVKVYWRETRIAE
jgi:hypothetical protein